MGIAFVGGGEERGSRLLGTLKSRLRGIGVPLWCEDNQGL
jgi:hypothetical protein